MRASQSYPSAQGACFNNFDNSDTQVSFFHYSCFSTTFIKIKINLLICFSVRLQCLKSVQYFHITIKLPQQKIQLYQHRFFVGAGRFYILWKSVIPFPIFHIDLKIEKIILPCSQQVQTFHRQFVRKHSLPEC